MTKRVMMMYFHPILAKALISLPKEMPMNAPMAAVGAMNCTLDVRAMTCS